jgi:hypothetical protein
MDHDLGGLIKMITVTKNTCLSVGFNDDDDIIITDRELAMLGDNLVQQNGVIAVRRGDIHVGIIAPNDDIMWVDALNHTSVESIRIPEGWLE